MTADAPRAAQDRWCDVQGRRIGLFCRVEQVAEHREQGTLFTRLYRRGQAVGRGPDVLYVRFDGESQLISLAPQPVRLLPDKQNERWY
jgi:hypothetical protein